jgi:DNA invertase Pin-like site-specific DNA recombinase
LSRSFERLKIAKVLNKFVKMKKKLQPILRVSSVGQWNKQTSVQDQLRQIEEYAEREGYEVAEPISIQISGKLMTMDKSQLSVALVNCKEKGMELAVSRLDRLSRSQIALLQLKEASDNSGVDCHVCSLGRTIKNISHIEFSMMALLADNERRTIQSRVARSMKTKTWKRAIGGTLDPQTLRIKGLKKRQRLAEEWAASVGLKKEIQNAGRNLKRPTYENVCAWLNGKGKSTRRGNQWTPSPLRLQTIRLGWNFKELVAS